MGKHKKKHKEKHKGKHNRSSVESCKSKVVNIDYVKLTEVLVEANQKIKESEEKKKIEQEEYDDTEWDQILHYKQCPDEENILIRAGYGFVNTVMLILSAVCFDKKNAKKPRVTFNLLRMLLSTIFGVCEWGLYGLSIMSVYTAFNSGSSKGLISMAIFSFLFARIFRIAKFEVENLKDQSLIVTIFSTMTSFVAMMIAIIALFLQIFSGQ